MDLNTENFSILTTGVQTIYQNAFNAYQPSVIYDQISTVTNSTTKDENYPWLGQSTGFREWLGDRVVQNLQVHLYAIRNKKFENTVGIPRDAIEDDTYGVFNPMFAQLGKDSVEHPDVLTFANVQNAGTLLCYDGKPFFSTQHPGVDAKKKPTTYSNDMGGNGPTWYLLCTTQVIKPFIFQNRRPYNFVSLTDATNPEVFKRDEFLFGVDGRSGSGFGLWQCAIRSNQPLTPENYEAARALMMSYLRDNGQPWNFVPDTIMCGPGLEGAANTIAKAQLVVVGDGTAPQSNIWQGTAKVLMTPRISW